MNRSSLLFLLCSSAAVFALAPASQSREATSGPPIEEVEVQGGFLTARDTQTLGQLLAAEEIFHGTRHRAPNAELRFKVFGREDFEQWKTVDLALLARDGKVAVTLDDTGRFVIDDAWRSLDPKTELRSRLEDGKVTWRADVRTPGSTARARRLGDLRLQCEASFFSGLARGASFGSGSVSRVVRSTLNGCDSKWFGWSAFADAPLLGIRFAYGDRAMHVSLRQIGGFGDLSLLPGYDWTYALRERMYRLHLGDQRWPDDTLVEFEFLDDPPQPVDPSLLEGSSRLAEAVRLLQPGATTLGEVNKRLGGSRGTLRYRDGRRALLYRPTGRAELELVAVFDSEDRLVKYALRPTNVRQLAAPVALPW